MQLDKEAFTIPENVTISIGIAFTEPYETSYTTLFQKADTALGNSKNPGNNVFPSMVFLHRNQTLP